MHEFSERHRRLLEPVDISGFGLEIGPSYNPILPKSAGFGVETLDYSDGSELREKYSVLPDTRALVQFIEPVDYVTAGKSMLETIGESGRYDFIIASHVVEHSPDLLGFLKDCQALLKPNGVLVLAVPDKRYCFDVFQPPSTTGQVLDAHRRKPTQASPGAVFDQFANAATREGRAAWPPSLETPLEMETDFATAIDVYRRAESSQEYIDVHIWRFVPSSFRLIVHDLNALGALGLYERKMIVDPFQAEFFVYLSRTAPPLPTSRLELHHAILRELAEPVCRTEVPSPPPAA